MTDSRLAIPELGAVRINGLTRQAFILRSAFAAGAVYGAGAVGPVVRAALAQGDSTRPPETSDVSILNFALTLEYLEAAFYAEALEQVPNLSSDASRLAKELQSNEAAHVGALTNTLGVLDADPVEEPRFDWGDSFADEATFLKTAVVFEDTGVSAYNGAAPMIQDKEILAAAGGIVQVEGRHAALVRRLSGQEPTIGAFDATLTVNQVLRAVDPFIRS